MQKTPYSPFKIVHHLPVISALREGEQPSPILVQIILSDLCNQDCSFCSYRLSGYPTNQLFSIEGDRNPNRKIPYGKVIEILDDCKDMGVKAIEYTGGGEPTVHPQHSEIFEYTNRLGLDLGLVTNGYLLSDRDLSILTHAKWIRISLDAGCDTTYSKIRRVSNGVYKRVLQNINQFLDRRTNTTVGISFVVLKDNYTEILPAIVTAKNLGVDYIRIGAVFSNDDVAYYKGILDYINSQLYKAKDFENSNFKVYNQFNIRYDDLAQGNPDYSYCGHQYINTYIGGDLNVYRCCATAYNNLGLVGTLQDKSFKDFWKSEEKRLKYATFDAQNCIRCPFNEKNKFLNYVLDKDIEHVNYV